MIEQHLRYRAELDRVDGVIEGPVVLVAADLGRVELQAGEVVVVAAVTASG